MSSTTELTRIRAATLPLQLEWCEREIRRAATVLRTQGFPAEIVDGNAFMADTFANARATIGELVRMRDRLGSCARFLLDHLQLSNEEIDALYGGPCDSPDQACHELREAIRAWEATK